MAMKYEVNNYGKLESSFRGVLCTRLVLLQASECSCCCEMVEIFILYCVFLSVRVFSRVCVCVYVKDITVKAKKFYSYIPFSSTYTHTHKQELKQAATVT